MIPRKIHYCWFGPKPYSDLISKCIASWKEIMPDYEFCLWNESNAPLDIPFVKKAYQAGKYAFVSDFIRFWVLYNSGGIYLDTDMFAIKRFDDLLNEEIFFGWEESNDHSVGCCAIGSIPKNQFIQSILEQYRIMDFDISKLSEYIIPRIVTKKYREFEDNHLIKVYPHDFFYPFPYDLKEDVRNFIGYRTENTYAIHLWNISWGKKSHKLRDRILYFLRKLWKRRK